MTDIVERLLLLKGMIYCQWWHSDPDKQTIDFDKIAKEAADEIERLRAEVLKWGDFIDTFPHGHLDWQSTAPMPPEFALNLHSEWWRKARDAFAGSLYLELYRKREAENKND